MAKYQIAAVGGTFDRLHAGHHRLLLTALNAANKVIIGITSPTLNQHKPLSNLIQSLATRKKNLRFFLAKHNVLNRVRIVTLNDPFGPALTNSDIDCLIVSKQTKPGGETLNQARIKRGYPHLPLIIADMVLDQSGQHLSSTRIRDGKVNRDGVVFSHLFNQDIRFSKAQLAPLKKPQSTVWQTNLLHHGLLANAPSISLIGDLVTKLFLDKNWRFNIAIIDHKSNRHSTPFTIKPTIALNETNHPGSINAHIAHNLLNLSNKNPSQEIVSVKGEEDLLAFVPCLTEPLNSVVIYGHPQGGVVIIRLTERNKQKFYHIIQNALKGEGK